MTLKPLKKPSELCGKCKILGEDCFCLCHTLPYTDSYHELITSTDQKIKVEKVTKFEDDYNLFDKIKAKLGFSV